MELNEEQIGALREAQTILGRRWKHRIRVAWDTGAYPVAVRHISGLLQQVRNRRPSALGEV